MESFFFVGNDFILTLNFYWIIGIIQAMLEMYEKRRKKEHGRRMEKKQDEWKELKLLFKLR
jgi:hypothetical protein